MEKRDMLNTPVSKKMVPPPQVLTTISYWEHIRTDKCSFRGRSSRRRNDWHISSRVGRKSWEMTVLARVWRRQTRTQENVFFQKQHSAKQQKDILLYCTSQRSSAAFDVVWRSGWLVYFVRTLEHCWTYLVACLHHIRWSEVRVLVVFAICWLMQYPTKNLHIRFSSTPFKNPHHLHHSTASPFSQ